MCKYGPLYSHLGSVSVDRRLFGQQLLNYNVFNVCFCAVKLRDGVILGILSKNSYVWSPGYSCIYGVFSSCFPILPNERLPVVIAFLVIIQKLIMCKKPKTKTVIRYLYRSGSSYQVQLHNCGFFVCLNVCIIFPDIDKLAMMVFM